MKFNGSSGVQVRMPSNLQDLAAYTSLKFYIQNPEPRSQQDEAEEGRFVLYLGSQEVRWGQRVDGALVASMISVPGHEPLAWSLNIFVGDTNPLDAAISLGEEWNRGLFVQCSPGSFRESSCLSQMPTRGPVSP